jgi:hypothetical protein
MPLVLLNRRPTLVRNSLGSDPHLSLRRHSQRNARKADWLQSQTGSRCLLIIRFPKACILELKGCAPGEVKGHGRSRRGVARDPPLIKALNATSVMLCCVCAAFVRSHR